MSISKNFKIWSVYVMAAPDASGLTYFKVGRTTDLAKRVCSVQTGCPLQIKMAWVITLWDNKSSLALERLMQKWLEGYHSHGEWFAMRTDDAVHKADMNSAFAQASSFASQSQPVKWRKMDIGELRTAMAAQAAEMAQESRRRAANIVRKATAMMAIRGRRIL